MDKKQKGAIAAVIAAIIALLTAVSGMLGDADAAHAQYGQADLEYILQQMDSPAAIDGIDVLETVMQEPPQQQQQHMTPAATTTPPATPQPQQPPPQDPVVNNIYITMPAQDTAMEEQLSQYWPLLLAVLIPIAALGIYFLFPMAKAKSDQMSINSAITAAKIADVGKSERVQGLDSQYFNALSSRMATNSANSAEALKEVAMQDVVRAQEEAAAKKKDA